MFFPSLYKVIGGLPHHVVVGSIDDKLDSFESDVVLRLTSVPTNRYIFVLYLFSCELSIFFISELFVLNVCHCNPWILSYRC